MAWLYNSVKFNALSLGGSRSSTSMAADVLMMQCIRRGWEVTLYDNGLLLDETCIWNDLPET